MDNKSLEWDAQLYHQSSSLQFELGLMCIKRLDLSGSESILEIGCGNAMLTIELSKRIPEGKITAIEISKEMVEKARENLALRKISNVDIINRNAIEIDYQDDFDIVFSNSAIHWIKNLELMYALLYKALRNGGRIMIQTGLRSINPTVKTIFKLVSLKKYRQVLAKFRNPWRYLTTNQTEEILILVGFRDINIEEYNHQVMYETKEDLLNYYKSATLVPFLTILPKNMRDEFSEDFMKIYLSFNNNELKVTMKRLFITALK